MNESRNPLVDQLIKVLKRNPERSHDIRRKRQSVLTRCCQFLQERYGLQNLRNLKMKHVHALVEDWKNQGVSMGEMHNRASHVRWLSDRIGKTRLIPKHNHELDLGPKPRYQYAGRYMSLEELQRILSELKLPEDGLMVMMGRYFGMRFREAALFRPNRDVAGNRLWITRGSKGGRPRFIWITTDEQRRLLSKLRERITERLGCLVGTAKTYKNWASATYKRFRRAGLSRAEEKVFHDLRRTYADEEFRRHRGKGMGIREAAKVVAKSLGHNREEVLKWYLPGGAR